MYCNSFSLSIALLLLGIAVATPYTGKEIKEDYFGRFQPGYYLNRVKSTKLIRLSVSMQTTSESDGVCYTVILQ